jgi:hypothetical protein
MKPFVSYDGKDENNVRAEVHVNQNTGIISDIKEGDKGTADVHFKVEGLKFPIHGWVGMDDNVYKAAVEAKAKNETVEFRIESQRKRKVDRTIPIAELRSSTDLARENTTPILAGINGLLSSEAVTNPREDPKQTSGGRYSATDEDMEAPAGNNNGAVGSSLNAGALLDVLTKISGESNVTNDVVAVVAGLALAAGADATAIHSAVAGKDRRDSTQPEPRQSFSVEAPAWKEFNSDGRFNLGSSAVQAGVGTEVFVRRLLSEINSEALLQDKGFAAVDYFTGLVLAIADRVQVASYGEGFKADRGAQSHTRVRGIVYDTIEHYCPLPVAADLTINGDAQATIKEWVASVGKLSVGRFRTAVERSSVITGFQIEIPASLINGSSQKVVDATASAPVTPPKPVSAPEPVVESPTPAEPVQSITAPQEELPEEPTDEEEPPAEEQFVESVVVYDETDSEQESENNADTLNMFPKNLLDESILVNGSLPADKAPSEENKSMFREFVNESELPQEELYKVARLLAWTFGPSFGKVANIPDEVLQDFLDFYIADGTEHFIEVLNKVAE